MKRLIVFNILFSVITSYAMYKTSYVALNQQEESSDSKGEKIGLADLSVDAWKEDSLTLHFNKKGLNSVEGLSTYCKPSPSSWVPPLFPYKTLTTILLQENALRKIRGEDFVGFENLRHLNLAHNKLAAIDIGSFFEACPRLKYFDLSHNEIKEVAWSSHKTWALLELAEHELYPENIRRCAPTINLTHNQIKQADRDWLQERYIEKMRPLRASGDRPLYSFLGCLTGTGVGGVVSILAAAGTAFSTPLAALGIPVGCAVGSLIGCAILPGTPLADEYYNAKLYFEEEEIPAEQQEEVRYLHADVSCWQL